jgi:CDP-glucose 4,6-dehydratase
MNKSFWQGKRVLVTGDTGFKGSWLSLILNMHGAKVQGISSSKFNDNAGLYSCLGLNKISNTIDCDIRDFDQVFKAFHSFNPEVVFHLAAQPLVRQSYQDPVTTYEVNVMGTMSILEAVKKSPSVQSAVMVTTDKCYKNNEWEWGYRENDPMGGHDPYSSSKACAELLTQSYQQSFFNDYINSPGVSTVRAGNVIGGGDFSEDRLIPDLYRAISTNNKLLLRNPLATRPWQHVFEPISGYLKVAERLFESGAKDNDCWNFGPNNSDIRIVEEITELFLASWGIENIIDFNSSIQPHEAKSLSLDISKAQFKLHWSPKWNLENAIEKTAIWYKAYFEDRDILKISTEQIEEYY